MQPVSPLLLNLVKMEKHAIKCEEENNFIDLIAFNGLIEDLFVPEFESGFDRPACSSDYLSYISNCNEKFERLISTIENCINFKYNDDKLKQKCISSAVILNGEHSSASLWTTEISLEVSKIALEKLLSIFGYLSCKDVLVSFNGLIFTNILKELRPKLLKNSWKNNGPAVICFSWVLQFVETPHLAEHLNSVLPTALILIDDFVSENRILGLKCMKHIIDNVGRTHLCWFSQDEVIIKALEPLVFFKEEELIEPLISVLMALLKKKYPQVVNVELLINDFDPIINNILHNMMLEQRLKIRDAYIKSLSIMIKARGLGMLLHSKALLKVIDEYVLEPTSSVEGLKVLRCFMETCWPRIHGHFDHIFLLICKIYLGILQKRYPDDCEKTVQEIVNILKNLCPKKAEERITEISKQQCLPTIQSLFA